MFDHDEDDELSVLLPGIMSSIKLDKGENLVIYGERKIPTTIAISDEAPRDDMRDARMLYSVLCTSLPSAVLKLLAQSFYFEFMQEEAIKNLQSLMSGEFSKPEEKEPLPPKRKKRKTSESSDLSSEQ